MEFHPAVGCNIDTLLGVMLPEGQSETTWQLHHYAIGILANEPGIYASTIVNAQNLDGLVDPGISHVPRHRCTPFSLVYLSHVGGCVNLTSGTTAPVAILEVG